MSGVDRGVTGRQPQAVRSALAVLQEVARAGAGVTAKEVAEALGLPPATTYRLLNLLVGEEYLVRLPDLHGFALGAKVAGLAGVIAPARVPTAARQVLADLRGRVRAFPSMTALAVVAAGYGLFTAARTVIALTHGFDDPLFLTVAGSEVATVVGMLVGAYSSIFVATPLLVLLRSREGRVTQLDRDAREGSEAVTAGDPA